MLYRQLGQDGPMLPVLGLGAWPLGGGMGQMDEAAAISLIHAAIDNGITLIDTAQAYRTSEATIGKALKHGYRERCFLATKVSWDYSHRGILNAMDNSLHALGVDEVDLYQLHSWNDQIPVEESMQTLEQLRQEGKTNYIGVSNFNAQQMQRALQTARFHSNQPRYNLFDREIEAEDIAFCEREGISLLAHSPLAKGLLTGKYTPDYQFPPDDERSQFPRFQGDIFAGYLAAANKLTGLARDKGLTLVQFALAWLLRRPAITCVLVGAKTPQQLEEYAGALGVTFSPGELAEIDRLLADAPKD